MKINNIRGDLTDFSARKEALISIPLSASCLTHCWTHCCFSIQQNYGRQVLSRCVWGSAFQISDVLCARFELARVSMNSTDAASSWRNRKQNEAGDFAWELREVFHLIKQLKAELSVVADTPACVENTYVLQTDNSRLFCTRPNVENKNTIVQGWTVQGTCTIINQCFRFQN